MRDAARVSDRVSHTNGFVGMSRASIPDQVQTTLSLSILLPLPVVVKSKLVTLKMVISCVVLLLSYRKGHCKLLARCRISSLTEIQIQKSSLHYTCHITPKRVTRSGPSPRLSVWAAQRRRNIATVASRWRHLRIQRFDLPGNRTPDLSHRRRVLSS